jgi:hypothetical protein
MPGELHRDGTRATLRFERTLPRAPEKVWRALTENEELAYWFPVQIQGERVQGDFALCLRRKAIWRFRRNPRHPCFQLKRDGYYGFDALQERLDTMHTSDRTI